MPVEGFSIKAENVNGRAVITLSGDIDMVAADPLWAALSRELTPNATVLVHCSAVDFLDSMGLRALIRAHHQAAEIGASFRLAEPSATVLRVLDLAGIPGLFDFAIGEGAG